MISWKLIKDDDIFGYYIVEIFVGMSYMITYTDQNKKKVKLAKEQGRHISVCAFVLVTLLTW